MRCYTNIQCPPVGRCLAFDKDGDYFWLLEVGIVSGTLTSGWIQAGRLNLRGGFDLNPLYKDLKNRYNWIGGFAHNLVKLTDPSIFSYFACGIRNRAGAGWLNTAVIEMPKMYAQELINALCILTEATLKLRPALTPFRHKTIGVLFSNLDAQTPSVSALVGKPSSNSGLFLTYPTGSTAEFNTNFSLLASALKTGNLTDDDAKAHLLYGAYMLRNKVLHNYDTALAYYNNVPLFFDAIAISFGAIAAALNI